jgi:NAD(P)-dependent dehydrogenase (short-subunit alcohol dehydrogenase family)
MTAIQSLSGRRVVVTGAGRGLGRALAIVAADQGAELVLFGRDPQALATVADTIRVRTRRDVASFSCDLANPDSVNDACSKTLAQASTIDVLINNGAPWLPGGILELSDADVANTIAAAVTGTVLVTKRLLPALQRSPAADIVTIVSTVALPGYNTGSASVAMHAAKHGQSGFSDRLREEVKKYRIRVTAIYPPDFDDTDPLSAEWDEVRDPSTGRTLTNREVVAAVMFAITAPRVCAIPAIVLDNMLSL